MKGLLSPGMIYKNILLRMLPATIVITITAGLIAFFVISDLPLVPSIIISSTIIAIVVASVFWGVRIAKRSLINKVMRVIEKGDIKMEGNFIAQITGSIAVNDCEVTFSIDDTKLTMAEDTTPPTAPRDIIIC
jgi:hypothetical protein